MNTGSDTEQRAFWSKKKREKEEGYEVKTKKKRGGRDGDRSMRTGHQSPEIQTRL